VHAQIGHNEPNQAASVHTIDNKPYIFERRRSLSGNSGNEVRGQRRRRHRRRRQLLSLARRNDLEDRGKIGRDSTRALRACFMADL